MATPESVFSRLMELMESMWIIDSHEHLSPEATRVASRLDFAHLFSHYCVSDFLAAGMTLEAQKRLYAADAAVDEKWSIFAPLYARVRDGSYCRATRLAMERFYGMADLGSLRDAEALTAAIRRENTPGLYRRVLKDACRIRVAMNYGSVTDDPEYFAPVIFVTGFAEVTPAVIRDLELRTGSSCATLGRYEEALAKHLEEQKRQGMKGLKLHFAYMRDLDFAPRTHAEAEAVFNRVMEEGYGWRAFSLGYEESRPLQDYLVHRLVQIAGDLDLPVVFHSALQAHANHKASDARPLPLWNLAHRYPHVRLVVLHAGLPWMEEAALLAKHFPNLYLDMGWTHLMSPEISTRALRSYVDLVPMHKVLGFGGDYSVVEKVFGHLVLARRDIGRALASKVADGDLTVERAEAWVRALLYDNPKDVFRLAVE